MSWSLGEIEALAIKAARGAGWPWGLAEEAGWAVRWLEARGLPGVQTLADCLSDGSDSDTIARGAYLRDQGHIEVPEVLNRVAHPLLLLAFLGSSCRPECGLMVVLDGHAVSVGQGGVTGGQDLPRQANVTIEGWTGPIAAKPHRSRVEHACPEALEILHRFAAQTYAPATEESRARGAGSGLNDND